jgi:hypothetical protein
VLASGQDVAGIVATCGPPASVIGSSARITAAQIDLIRVPWLMIG